MAMSKRAVLILVIIAIILATSAITLSVVDTDTKVSTVTHVINGKDIGIAQVGVTVEPPAIEDKGAES